MREHSDGMSQAHELSVFSCSSDHQACLWCCRLRTARPAGLRWFQGLWQWPGRAQLHAEWGRESRCYSFRTLPNHNPNTPAGLGRSHCLSFPQNFSSFIIEIPLSWESPQSWAKWGVGLPNWGGVRGVSAPVGSRWVLTACLLLALLRL